jgi:hypothetical protein
MLNLQQATQLPDPSVIATTPKDNAYNDFKVIETPVVAADKNSATVRLGAAVTAEEFRRWATSDGKWCLPMDVILVEYVSILSSLSSETLTIKPGSQSVAPMAAYAMVPAMIRRPSTIESVLLNTLTSTASTKRSPTRVGLLQQQAVLVFLVLSPTSHMSSFP